MDELNNQNNPTVVPEKSIVQEPQNGFMQSLMENKKLVMIVLAVVAAIIIGLSILIGAKSSDEYQGLIQRIDTETQELNKSSQTNISSQSFSQFADDEIIPASGETIAR